MRHSRPGRSAAFAIREGGFTVLTSIENILVLLSTLLQEIQRLASAAFDAGREILALILGT